MSWRKKNIYIYYLPWLQDRRGYVGRSRLFGSRFDFRVMTVLSMPYFPAGFLVSATFGLSETHETFNSLLQRMARDCPEIFEPKFDFGFFFSCKPQPLDCSSFVVKAVSFYVIADAVCRRSTK